MNKYLLILTSLLCFVASAQNELKLPDLGNPSDQVLSPDQEALYRKNIRQQMYQYSFMMTDPFIADYIEHLGYRLVTHSDNPEQDFEFHLIPADVINASAYPGGLIVVYSGLLLETDTESELAGVVAHEIAHVNQRHISRMMAKQRKSIAPLLLGMVAAVAAAQTSSSSDAPIAIAASMQAMQAQMQINFTRYHEYEADRVGIQTLYKSGMNPEGMASFFSKLMKKNRIDPRYSLPEYLSTHPLSINRVTEAKNRIKNYEVKETKESELYPFIKERIRVLTAEEFDHLNEYYRDTKVVNSALMYGKALQQLKMNQFDQALATISIIKAPKEAQHLIDALHAEVLSEQNPEVTLEVVQNLIKKYPASSKIKEAVVKKLIQQNSNDALKLAIKLLRDLTLQDDQNPHYHDLLSIAYYNDLNTIESGMSLARKSHLLGLNYRAVRVLKNLKKEKLDYYQQAEVDALISAWEPLISEEEHAAEQEMNRRGRR
ncbi:M48 family metalloprotease [Marinicella rhabdoformis]|uniref:M48 family metalloprotease n=1 Tax=Marinicella rhabdoformis TaxID=2580566 RepID=UPI0012AED921|nr:M48 family metalloprotease [Marinicella rhabdoformis]